MSNLINALNRIGSWLLQNPDATKRSLYSSVFSSAITTAFEQVDEQDFWNWFTHCCYCTPSTLGLVILV